MALFAAAFAPPVVGAEDGAAPAVAERAPAALIAADDALEHVGEECTVEFVVAGGRKLDDKAVCFLNSRKDHREPGTFTVVIFRDGLARFATDGIDDPAEAFAGQTIRVTGRIDKRNEQAQIVVESPAQIAVAPGATAGDEAVDR